MKKEIQSKKCKKCGVNIIRKGGVFSNIQWEKIKFCSKICFGKEHSKQMKGRPSIFKGVNWKGDKVCYSGLHLRIRKLLPKPNECQNCGKVTDYSK